MGTLYLPPWLAAYGDRTEQLTTASADAGIPAATRPKFWPGGRPLAALLVQDELRLCASASNLLPRGIEQLDLLDEKRRSTRLSLVNDAGKGGVRGVQYQRLQ